jgi:hypothetical protein
MTPAARRSVAALAVAVLLLTPAGPAGAQEPGSSTTVGVPAQDIIPEPDTGDEPSEAGDRGGALQLGVLALVVAVMVGGVLFLVRQSRHARAVGDR